FFHGTGHGVGLDIHEMPRISVRDDILKTRQVVTVEPGLYYPEIGGVRLEDMVVVRENGCDNLTRFHRRLEIA
ncbi:MAG: M24 family metallopeptidase, partial [Mariprofundaceae bacterium]|nr:M24 family metallopeptidase [Mariprofundaceae bacterium]